MTANSLACTSEKSQTPIGQTSATVLGKTMMPTKTTRDLRCGYTTVRRVGGRHAAKDAAVKLYCFDIDKTEEKIVFGGELNGKPFMAVHELKNSNLKLQGYKPEDIANKEEKVKEQKNKVSPEKYRELVAKCQKEISDMKTAHLTFPKLDKCIFNVMFYSSSPTLIVGTDFKSTLVICELGINDSLTEISSIQIHSDLIQSMIVVNSYIYTCSADRTVVRTKFNAKEAFEAAENSKRQRKIRFESDY